MATWLIERMEPGVEVPMPTKPELKTLNFEFMSNKEEGAAVPMPTFPFASTVIKVEVEVPAVVEAIVKRGVLTMVEAEFEIDNKEYGEVVPMPTLPLK